MLGTTARHFYDDLGIFTLDDLEAYAEQLPNEEASAYNLKLALLRREDFAKPIPRAEVEAIAKVVEEHLEALEPGTQYTICGGYRRGKLMCGDVDIIVTHPDRQKYQGLCARLVKRLQKSGKGCFSVRCARGMLIPRVFRKVSSHMSGTCPHSRPSTMPRARGSSEAANGPPISTL